MNNTTAQQEVVYKSAKTWQMGFFALNNTATNLYMFMLMFVMYYATGIAGLMVATVGSILTFMRIWDGFTDPIIGFWIDKTESRIGKFRPFMLMGNIILAVMTVILFATTHLVPESIRLLYFVGIYGLYIIGYTFQTACTKAAQTVLTNDPKQRPLFTLFDAIYNTALFIGGQMLVASYLVPKHGGFTMDFFKEFLMMGMVLSAIFTVLAVISIWKKDVKENWGAGEVVKTRFRDYLPIIKGNRPLQMLIVSAATDKLANQTKSNAVTTVIVYGVLMGNYALSGKLMLITAIPTILITFVGIALARRTGIKKAYVLATWICVGLSVGLLAFMRIIDLKTISITPLNGQTVLYLAILSLLGGVAAVGGNIVIPMIADTSDYETFRTGRYIPGMMGTIFSFVDKLISSLATALIGFMLAFIGFRETLPTVDTPSSEPLFWMAMLFFIGMPVFGWLASLIAMKFYELDGTRMKEIHQILHERKLRETAPGEIVLDDEFTDDKTTY
ncbi:MFS transporter [Anaerotalea alkaliphila]|uniref:Glucuronide permease n=1 Tax=Anaerotalea alkaliphila TaxID=2662126 RepID=A0A7X5KPF6_9FIRM|nr:MFS transporter [Anaerotalea alkaliphila]NDL68027.1 glucuronide permease [Anaerotalea alkaliphila]